MNQEPSNDVAQVLVVDDHPVVRGGLTRVINREPDLHVCGGAEDAGEALEAIASQKPDLVIVDIRLKTSSGLDLIRDIRARFGQLPVLVLSMLEEKMYAERALKAGADGFVAKTEPATVLLGAIRQVLAGRVYVGKASAEQLLESMTNSANGIANGPEHLSDRELEVFRLIGQGLPRREIARRLHRSIHTVDSHVARIKAKLNVKTASELTQYAIQWSHDDRAG